MVIDTSAIMAMLLDEPSADRVIAAVEMDTRRLVSAATVVEASLVMLGRYGEAGDPLLDRLLRSLAAEVVPVDEEQVALARDAALRYGRGRAAASLNFGDSFSYALAVARNEPLLFVGDDFSKTDVEVCPW
ncbi:MAG: type II toxin-antitoxin system VapC family toxin [Gemmatimonadales bacterium]